MVQKLLLLTALACFGASAGLPFPVPAAVADTAAVAPAWDPSATYLGGEIVSYSGINYKAGWWVRGGDDPKTAYAKDVWGVWRPTADAPASGGTTGGTTDGGTTGGGTTTPPSDGTGTGTGGGATTAPAWDFSATYLGGEIVSYSGLNYKAQWWTKGGDDPKTAYAKDAWGVWRPTTETPTSGGTTGGTTGGGTTGGTGSTPPPSGGDSGSTPPPVVDGAVVNSPGKTWVAKTFSPYVDITLTPAGTDMDNAIAKGVTHFCIGFITAGTDGSPSFAGASVFPKENTEWDTAARLVKRVNAVRAKNGDVMMSFGGASGTELSVSVTDETKLAAAYRSVIDFYKLTAIDFDIEGAAVADTASIARRNRVIAALQREYPGLQVWFTLPVFPSGLTNDGLAVVRSALAAGVNVTGVNGMTMDYGPWARNGNLDMGDHAVAFGGNLVAQLRSLYAERGVTLSDASLWAKVGITPMIGQNDVQEEVFTLDDARQVLDFAKANGVGMVGMWSVTRDHAGSSPWASATNSGISQQDYEFSSIFSALSK